MNNLKKLTVVSAALSLSLLGACTAGHVKPADRDTTGAFDGVWIGSVAGPRSSRVSLPGKWYMSCSWEPYDVYLTVDDGRVQLGRLEGKTLVSEKGDFRIDVTSGPAGMTGGVMSGNGEHVQIFSGNLAGGNPRGSYAQFITSIGTSGCTAPIRFQRDSSSVS